MMDFAYNQKTASHAPALVILTTITGRSGFERDGSFSTSRAPHWQSFDAGIAAEAFCLAAHAYGLGTVIMGVFEESEVRKVIELPEGRGRCDHRHQPSSTAAGSRTQGRRYPAASDRLTITS
ncbi:MAG: nitroreductase family protein [Butyricicoccaceae bacterium]